MEDLKKYTPTEILKLINDIKIKHETLKEEITKDTEELEVLGEKINKKLEELDVVENEYVKLIEELNSR